MGKSEKWNKEGKEKDVGLKRGSQVLLWLVGEIKIHTHSLKEGEGKKERQSKGERQSENCKNKKIWKIKRVSYKEKSSLKPI